MDDALRNTLWNLFMLEVLPSQQMYNIPLKEFCQQLLESFFKLPINLAPNGDRVELFLFEKFLEFKWFEVYDFMQHFGGENEYYSESLNKVLQREGAAYRMVGGKITPITSEGEIAEIETAIENSGSAVGEHLSKALAFLSDKQAPDYKNSIKESISAVESQVGAETGGKGTLGSLLKQMELHPALEKAFSQLYGYTSDEGGIRHAMLEGENGEVGEAEARFFLVACSAFVNYLQAKA